MSKRSSRSRLLRNGLALSLGFLGWMGFSGDTQAFYADREPSRKWDRRVMFNGMGGCKVPYTEELLTDSVRDTFHSVIEYVGQHTSCLWTPKTWMDTDYVAVREKETDWFDFESHSRTGKMGGGAQELSICHGCSNFQSILHEMGHAMGLKHEVSRPDRDIRVEIFPEFIQSDYLSQYAIDDSGTGTFLGMPYDGWSVMQYGGFDFMKPGWYPFCSTIGTCRTVKFKSGGTPAPSEQFTGEDLLGMKRRYPIPQQMTAMHSGKCIEIPGTTDDPNFPFKQTRVDQRDCDLGAHKGWLFNWVDNDGQNDYYTIESAHPYATGKCLDVQWGSQDPNTPVWLWDCTGDHAQQWALSYGSAEFGPYGTRVRARHSGQCMSVFGGLPDNGAQIVQLPCETDASLAQPQIWGFGFIPEAFPEDIGCQPGQISDCQYDIELKRVVCDCL